MFSEIERKIGLELLKGEKTAEELAECTNEDIRDILEGLKRLMKLKIVVRDGFPPKYKLSDHVHGALKNELENVEGIKVRATIEVQGLEENVVEKVMEKIKRSLKKERGIHVSSVQKSSIEKTDEGMYSAYVDVRLVFEGFEPLMRFIFFYGPSTIEILNTEEITIKPDDFQRGVLEAASMVQGYVSYITKLMTKKELEEFNKKMWRELFK